MILSITPETVFLQMGFKDTIAKASLNFAIVKMIKDLRYYRRLRDIHNSLKQKSMKIVEFSKLAIMSSLCFIIKLQLINQFLELLKMWNHAF